MNKPIFFYAAGVLTAGLTATVATAQPTTKSLTDVLSSAKALTVINDRTIVAATSDGGFLCDVGVNPSYFQQVANGTNPSPGFVPTALCVSAQDVKNVGGK